MILPLFSYFFEKNTETGKRSYNLLDIKQPDNFCPTVLVKSQQK